MKLHTTTTLCGTCREALLAEVVARSDHSVWMTSACATHGEQAIQISPDANWYMSNRAIGSPAKPPAASRPISRGCPFDCGPCASHTQAVRLPVVTITSACNLDCPICYVFNNNHSPFHMSVENFRRTLAHLVERHGGPPDLLNLTGGDPTLHPELLQFLQIARDAGVSRVSLCTNGLKLLQDPTLLPQLASLGARVALSFDSFEEGPDRIMQGVSLVERKLQILDALEAHDIPTTLIPVMVRGLNDHEIGAMVALSLERPNIRHLEVHLITYTGQNGRSFDRSGRITLHEVLLEIEAQTLLCVDDFVPSPCAHPLCYQIAYLLMNDGDPIPFTRFMDRQTLYACLGDRLYLEPSPRLERALLEAIDTCWANGDDRTTTALKRLLESLFPDKPLSRAEALAVAERSVKAVYVHAHMDEENFDTERVAMCCASDCHPDGSTVPICTTNVLHKQRNPAFNPHGDTAPTGPGQLTFHWEPPRWS